MPHFTELIDLAAERLGGVVLHANDEFFAPKENLLKPGAAVWIEDKYTDRGKWMDGWESRRRRTPGHDFCVLKLGLAGVIRGVDVDTAFFRGNYPEECSIDACLADAKAEPGALGPWHPVLPRSPLVGNSHNYFAVRDRRRWSHLRLQIYPDGGVARLRVHGEVVPDWGKLCETADLDLAALENGGLVLGSNDAFFGHHNNLLMPGRADSMKEGWETRRKRRPGHDWVILRLGVRGTIRQVVVDTNHFKGNFPDRCSLEVCDAEGASFEALSDPRQGWQVLMPETKLEAHTRHFFERELRPVAAASHLRMRIYPDGGVSRLRVFGRAAAPLEALTALNQASREDAIITLLRCCGSRRFAEAVADQRPFAVPAQLFAAAADALDDLDEPDWLEAFRAHPRIGDRDALRAKFAATRAWAEGEQAGAMSAPDAVIDALAAGNQAYETRFAHVFLICATGKSAEQMLASLTDRMPNPPDIELGIAADEQRKITRLRLEKLLTP